MKVSNYYNQNKYNPNFTAIRIVKTSPDEFLHFANNYKNFYKKNFVFRAQSYEQSLFFEHLKTLAVKENASQKWVINNAVRYKLIDYDTINNLPMCVFTGKDIVKLTLYNFKNMIPNFIRSAKFSANAAKNNFPKHLVAAKAIKETVDSDLPRFQKFLKKNNAKYVTYNEFLQEIKTGNLDS